MKTLGLDFGILIFVGQPFRTTSENGVELLESFEILCMMMVCALDIRLSNTLQ